MKKIMKVAFRISAVACIISVATMLTLMVVMTWVEDDPEHTLLKIFFTAVIVFLATWIISALLAK